MHSQGASARSLYRSLLRARMALPGAEVRTQLRYACGAQFRARRAIYEKIRDTAGSTAAEDAQEIWQRDAAADLGMSLATLAQEVQAIACMQPHALCCLL